MQQVFEKVLSSSRLTDEMVFKVVDKNRLVRAMGKSKEIYMVDTCNVYHYGSRKSDKPRIMISCMYASPFSLSCWNKPGHRKHKFNITPSSKNWEWSLSDNN